MKRNLLLVLAALFGVSVPVVAQSSNDDYVPLVVEGAKWECDYATIFHDMRPNWITPYSIEIKGDTIIDDVAYKCCVYTFEESSWSYENYSSSSPADTLILAFIREDVENKKVYARFNKNQYHEVYCQNLPYNDEVNFDNEFLLYDFANIDNPDQLWVKNSNRNVSSIEKGEILINGIARDCYYLGNELGCIIEGIGYDGYGFQLNAGDLMCQFPAFVAGIDAVPVFKAYQTANGETIYKSGDALNVFNGVEGVDINTIATEMARYDIYGRKLSQPTNGINIVKMSDGTTRKLIIKN